VTEVKIQNVLAQRADERKAELSNRRLALQIAEREGLNLVPVEPFAKKVAIPWRHYQENKSTKEQWEEWFIKNNYGLAVVCGRTSENLVIIDCDKKEIAKRVFGKTAKELAQETFVVETGSKKGHYQIYYKADYPVKGKKFHNLGIPLEILGQGNIAVFPPSWHPSGNRYEAVNVTTPVATWHGDIVEEIYDYLERAFGKKFKADKLRETINIDKLLHGVEEGFRDEAAIRIASWYRQAEVPEEDAEKLLLEWNDSLKEPLEDGQILEKVRSAYSRAEPYHYKFNKRYVPETIFDPEIVAKADEILEKGDPFEFINKAVATIHAGDILLIQIEWISSISSHVARVKINLWQIGKSQKGKSHSMYSTLHVVPKEYYEIFTSSSPLAFFYYVKKYGEWSLDKKLIYIDEVEASKSALPTLRALTGQTDITPRHLSVHEAQVLDLEIKGKRSTWFTSVETFGSEQIKNRFIHLNPDETPEQDDRVFDIQIDKFWENIEVDDEPLLVAQAMTQKIVKETAHLKVKKPFKPVWPYKSRRWLFPIFVGFVDSIVKAMYKQRKIEGDFIIAQKEDIEKAKELWKIYEKNIVYRVSATAIMIYELIPELKEEAMTHAEIAETTGLSTDTVRRHCKELTKEGLFNFRKRATGGRGAWEYWKSKQCMSDSIGLQDDKKLYRKNLRKKNKKSILKNHSKTVRKSGKDVEFRKKLWPDSDETQDGGNKHAKG